MKEKLLSIFWQFYNGNETKLQRLASRFPDSLTPNFLTFLRIVLLAPIILAIQEKRFLFATILFLIAYFLDIIDGPLARVKNQITEFGKVFDPTADKVVFLSVLFILGKEYLPISLIYIIFSLEVILILLVIMFRPLASALGLDVKLGANIFGKIKMFFQTLGIMALFFLVTYNLTVLPSTIILIIATLFSIFSIVGHILAVQKKKTPL